MRAGFVRRLHFAERFGVLHIRSLFPVPPSFVLCLQVRTCARFVNIVWIMCSGRLPRAVALACVRMGPCDSFSERIPVLLVQTTFVFPEMSRGSRGSGGWRRSRRSGGEEQEFAPGRS